MSAFAVSFGPFAVGLSKGYTSPALASMQATSLPADNATAAEVAASMTSLSITEQQGSWIASLSLLGALFGGLSAGVVIKYGRRRTLWLVTAPFSASWFLTMFATCVEMIYVTAFLVGFFSAIIQLATQVRINRFICCQYSVDPACMVIPDIRSTFPGTKWTFYYSSKKKVTVSKVIPLVW